MHCILNTDFFKFGLSPLRRSTPSKCQRVIGLITSMSMRPQKVNSFAIHPPAPKPLLLRPQRRLRSHQPRSIQNRSQFPCRLEIRRWTWSICLQETMSYKCRYKPSMLNKRSTWHMICTISMFSLKIKISPHKNTIRFHYLPLPSTSASLPALRLRHLPP